MNADTLVRTTPIETLLEGSPTYFKWSTACHGCTLQNCRYKSPVHDLIAYQLVGSQLVSVVYLRSSFESSETPPALFLPVTHREFDNTKQDTQSFHH